MEWFSDVGALWVATVKWLVYLAIPFGLLVRFMPCNVGMAWWRDARAAFTDLIYWFIVPVFLRICRLWLLIAGVMFFYNGQRPDALPVRALPFWQQCILVHVLQDVLLYWLHRLFHTRLGWKFHAVHHSPEQLDWTAMARFHPVNNLLCFCLVDIITILLGFPEETLIALTPINVVYSALVHANLNWTFGPFKYLLASPVFHRWHHTTEAEGLDKNFAPTYPLLDIVFGTFYMPAGRLPAVYGNGDPDFPEDFLGQFLYPFLPKRPEPAPEPMPLRKAA